CFAQFEVLVHGELGEGGHNHVVDALQVRAQLLDLFCFSCFRDCHDSCPLYAGAHTAKNYSFTFAASSTAVVSSAIPGPIEEERNALLMYLPLAALGLAFTTLVMMVVALSTRLFAGTLFLPTGTCTSAFWA